MTRVFHSLLTLLLVVLLVPAQSAPTPMAVVDIPAWVAPPSRDKKWTPFAPKPITGDNIFKGEGEKWLAEAIVNVETGTLRPISDKQISEYVSKVGQNLVAHSADPKKQFEFVVIPDESENAFDIGGGRVFVNLGLLRSVQSEDELAAVMAHEIGHDVFMHAPKTVTRQMFWMTGTRKITSQDQAETELKNLLAAYRQNDFAAVGENLLGWSRFNELEADKAGFYNMFKAGYNPEAMKNVFRRFVEQTKRETGDDYAADYFLTLLFGSHPPSSQRVTALKWESNWISMPPKTEQYKNGAFDAMKARAARL